MSRLIAPNPRSAGGINFSAYFKNEFVALDNGE
jgi:hypothetical protein